MTHLRGPGGHTRSPRLLAVGIAVAAALLIPAGSASGAPTPSPAVTSPGPAPSSGGVRILVRTVLTLRARLDDGRIAVGGELITAGGHPAPGRYVTVQVAGGRPVTLVTDPMGTYGARLAIPADAPTGYLPIVASFSDAGSLLGSGAQASVYVQQRRATRVESRAHGTAVPAGDSFTVTGRVLMTDGKPVPQGQVQITTSAGDQIWAISPIAHTGYFSGTLTLPSTVSPGRIVVTIDYPGDESYLPSRRQFAVQVAARTPTPTRTPTPSPTGTPGPTAAGGGTTGDLQSPDPADPATAAVLPTAAPTRTTGVLPDSTTRALLIGGGLLAVLIVLAAAGRLLSRDRRPDEEADEDDIIEPSQPGDGGPRGR